MIKKGVTMKKNKKGVTTNEAEKIRGQSYFKAESQK